MSIFDMKLFKFFGYKKKPKAPWSKYYTKEQMNLEIPDISMYQAFHNNISMHPNSIAISYFGTKITFTELDNMINECYLSFLKSGIRKNDVVTVCMPNTPEAVVAIFALNKIGAIANMVHPLLSENEIKHSIISTGSVMLVLIDMDYSKIKDIIDETDVYRIIVIRPSDSMPKLIKFGYKITQGRKTALPKKNDKYVFWNDFIKEGKHYIPKSNMEHIGKNDPCVMLHSGGTTGTPKEIVLSNGSFTALGMQAKIVLPDLSSDDSFLSIMPVFHGFGLGACVFVPLYLGSTAILIPRFDAKKFDKLLIKHKPSFVIGVPTLFEAMTKIPKKRSDKLNLNFLKYVITGGDKLKPKQDEEISQFLSEHGAHTRLIQGYGMSECLGPICLEIKTNITERSIGIPFPSCYMGIFDSNDKEVPFGEEGEICVSGPNLMLGYYNNEKETNIALHIHKDGNIWLHSGDLGTMNKDGFITYTGRIKRMIISSGYNVYPIQIETLLESCEEVMVCSVVGIPHSYKIEVPKAYIVLNSGYKKSDKLTKKLKELCKKNLPKYAQPYEIEFRESLPKTLIGKVDFRALQKENNENRVIDKDASK